MTATELRNWQRANPFVPFQLLLPGEKRLNVPHPDFLTISPSGRIAEVWDKDDSRVTLDVFLILGIQQVRRKAKPKKEKRSRRQN
jgi:hypothetical protein